MGVDLMISKCVRRVRSGWHKLLIAAHHLSAKRILFASVEPIIMSKGEGKEFEEILRDDGFYIHSVISPPERILFPHTTFQPVLIGIGD
jgi:hypothetical protein